MMLTSSLILTRFQPGDQWYWICQYHLRQRVGETGARHFSGSRTHPLTQAVLTALLPTRLYRFAVRRNCGGRRIFVACSKAYTILISVGSLHADAKNEIPTGRPRT
jgi:hypothetical protein